MTEDVDVPTAATGFVVTIGPPGSAAPTLQSYSGSGSFSRSLNYFWDVPNNVNFNSIGYTILIADAANNVRTASGVGFVTIGTVPIQHC